MVLVSTSLHIGLYPKGCLMWPWFGTWTEADGAVTYLPFVVSILQLCMVVWGLLRHLLAWKVFTPSLGTVQRWGMFRSIGSVLVELSTCCLWSKYVLTALSTLSLNRAPRQRWVVFIQHTNQLIGGSQWSVHCLLSSFLGQTVKGAHCKTQQVPAG